MARPRRTFVPGESLHVYNRGNNRMTIFHEEIDYQFFLFMMERAAAHKGVSVHAVVLMTTHFHVLATPAAEYALSWTMKELCERYARFYNDKYERTGTLWESRFGNVPMADDDQNLVCLRYIDQNPVRANMVTSPDAYPWSSYSLYAFGQAWSWLAPHPSYLELGRSDDERKQAYRAICAEPIPVDALLRMRRKR